MTGPSHFSDNIETDCAERSGDTHVLDPLAIDAFPASLPSRTGATEQLPRLEPTQHQTSFTWDMAADFMHWEENAAAVLGIRSTKDLSTGSSYQFLIVAEHAKRRQDAFERQANSDDTRGTAYCVTYRLLPGGRRTNASLWVEERGRWWQGIDGKPVRARGVVRILQQDDIASPCTLGFSDYDELTGQLNRLRLIEAIEAAVTRAKATDTTCALLMLAVNNLSDINKTFGFAIGDHALVEVGKIVAKLLRGGDTIGRYSSNKFGVILNDCSPSAIRIAAERFIKAIRTAALRPLGCPISVTISVGGIQVPRQADTVEKAVSRSLETLERGRHKIHDSFTAYEASAHRENLRARNRAIADEINSALDENRMRILVQPIVASRTHEIAFCECLLRLERPDGSLAGASEFIPVAEQLGMSRLIDRRALELSVELAKSRPDLTLSLNVSSLTCSDHDWLIALHRLTRGERGLSRRLIVEITETMAIHDLDQTIAFVDSLKELGCRVAIDDFGAGYTSFKNLKHLQADLVKIDGSFANNIADDPADRIFMKSLADLAASFGMETVAEWIGDARSAQIISDMGITYMQGYYFGTPVDASLIGQRPAKTG